MKGHIINLRFFVLNVFLQNYNSSIVYENIYKNLSRNVLAPRSRLASDNLNNGGLDTPPLRGHAVPGNLSI